MRAIIAIAFALALAFVIPKPTDVDADHGVVRCGGEGQKACIALTLDSPLIRYAIYARGEATYCLNARAGAYPGFRSQIQDVMADQFNKLGVSAREVDYPADARDASCNIRHEMPEQLDCGGCAARVWLLNWPVVVEYRWQFGFLNWRTADAHENGHATCLLDEHYDKWRFVSFFLTYGYWIHGWPTVMDFGTFLWLLTEYDVARCFETLLPLPVQEAGIDLSTSPPTLYYKGADRRADRIAVMAKAPDGGYYWTGNHLPAGAYGSLPLYSAPGWEFFFNSEISGWPESWLRPWMRNDVSAGWMP